MVYINTTGKHNEVWLDKPYATITVECPDCPSTEDAYNSGWTDGSEDGYHKGYQSGSTDGWGAGYPSGYTDGVNSVICDDCQDFYDSGYTSGYDSGYTDGSNSVDCTDFYNSGVTDGYASGYTSGRTDGYDDGWQPGYDSGYTDGLEACSGSSCNLQASKTVRLHNYEWTYYPGDHGHYGEYQLRHNPEIISADTGYDGMKEIVLRGYIDASDAFIDGFNSGYTAGLNVCSGGNEDLIANLQGDYYVIPEGTTHLRDYAFEFTCFSSITIPNSVTSIGNYAFLNNLCLTSITIPDSVNTLGTSVFNGCKNLVSAILGSGCTRLPDSTFGNCGKLTGMTIPSTITSLGNGVFAGCSGLTHMTFEGLVPPTLGKISGSTASLGSTAYTFPIYVPCQSLDAYKTAFGEYYAPRIMCNSGTSGISMLDFIYETTSPNEKINLFTGDAQYTNSYFKAFYSAITFMEIDGVVVYPNPADIEIYQGGGEDRINLYTHTFAQSGSHTVKFYMDKSFSASTSTGTKYPAYELTELIFASNSNIKCPITEATIGDGYEYVHMGVFQGSDILTSATIPSSVTAITNFVFENSALKILTCNRTTHPSLGVDVFNGANSLKHIYVPAESVEDYKAATNWSNYASIISAIQ